MQQQIRNGRKCFFIFESPVRFLLLLAVVAISASTTVAADHWRRDVDRVPVGVLASLPAACLAPDAVDFVDLLESLSRVSPVSNLKMRTQKSSAPAGTQMTHCYKVVEI